MNIIWELIWNQMTRRIPYSEFSSTQCLIAVSAAKLLPQHLIAPDPVTVSPTYTIDTSLHHPICPKCSPVQHPNSICPNCIHVPIICPKYLSQTDIIECLSAPVSREAALVWRDQVSSDCSCSAIIEHSRAGDYEFYVWVLVLLIVLSMKYWDMNYWDSLILSDQYIFLISEKMSSSNTSWTLFILIDLERIRHFDNSENRVVKSTSIWINGSDVESDPLIDSVDRFESRGSIAESLFFEVMIKHCEKPSGKRSTDINRYRGLRWEESTAMRIFSFEIRIEWEELMNQIELNWKRQCEDRAQSETHRKKKMKKWITPKSKWITNESKMKSRTG